MKPDYSLIYELERELGLEPTVEAPPRVDRRPQSMASIDAVIRDAWTRDRLPVYVDRVETLWDSFSDATWVVAHPAYKPCEAARVRVDVHRLRGDSMAIARAFDDAVQAAIKQIDPMRRRDAA